MYNPKTEVYNKLKALGYTCIQGNQATFTQVPAITFNVADNVPRYGIDKEISSSEVEIIVDIWTNDSVTGSSVAQQVEAAMREIDYLLTYSADIPYPEGSLYHIQMRFGAIKI